MLKRLLQSPALITLSLTLASILVSLIVTKIALVAADMDVTPVAYLLAGILPVVVAPLCLYPFARANARLRRMRTELERVARTDVLTDLPNRRGFFQASEAILARVVAPPATIALLMADVDHFKALNDTRGHDAGDTMLKIVGETIRDSVALAAADEWTVSRLGGEEFVALVEGLVPSAVGRLAERICQNVRKIEVDHRGEILTATVSIGVAFRAQGMDIDNLLRAADDAVYLAKRSGRDRWCFATAQEMMAAEEEWPPARASTGHVPS